MDCEAHEKAQCDLTNKKRKILKQQTDHLALFDPTDSAKTSTS